MFTIWKECIPVSNITEQRLADQQRVILKNSLLTEAEIEEIRRNTEEREYQTSPVQCQPETPAPPVMTQIEELPVSDEQINIIDLTQEEEDLKEHLVNMYQQTTSRCRLPPLKLVYKKTMNSKLNQINRVLTTIPTSTLEETNRLMYAAASLITTQMGYKITPNGRKREERVPRWKIRLQNNINNWRKDISNLENLKNRKLKKRRVKNELIYKYFKYDKSIKQVIEELKQRIIATSKKIERYEGRTKQYKENRLFQTNQKRFYQQLEGKNITTITPDSQETLTFWKNIWSEPVEYNKEATWLNQITPIQNKMEDLIITKGKIKQMVKRMKNWSAPGLDELHAYWLKHLDSMHERMATQMNSFIQSGEGEEWLSTGKTILLMKDPNKGLIPGNYRPITCLPTTFKLLTSIIAVKIQDYLENNNLIPEEQKGNRRQTRGTKDQLLIDKMILRNSKRRKTNLNMAWIDYKKAFDSVPHTWIQKCLQIYGVSTNIQDFLKKIMMKWSTILTANGITLGQINIRRGIFQGDSLSPLLFILALVPLSTVLRQTEKGYQTSKTANKISHLLYMDDLKLYAKTREELELLVNTVRTYSEDIGMEFGIDKCAILTMQRGKITESEGITMPDKNVINQIKTEEAYKYLGVLQAEEIKHSEMKEKATAEYRKRLRKILKSKLNGGNIIKAMNTWATPVIRYTAGVINWTQAELADLDRKTRKLMTANGALHPKSDVDRLYLKRKEGGRGLQQIAQTVEEEIRSLADYINESKESALIEVKESGILKQAESKEGYRNKVIEERKQKYIDKPLHGQYMRDICGKTDETLTWKWLTIGELKKETEALILAAQDQALRTNAIKAKIDKTSTNSKCRLCKVKEETVDHLVSSCSKIAQTDYKERHDKVARMLHWNLCKNYNIQATDQWWKHQPEKVIENEEVKILWDFQLQTDRKIAHNIPDITVIERDQIWLIDVAIPGDARIEDKTLEKITKYQDLRIEIQRLMERKTTVVPVIVGALGAVPRDLTDHLKTLKLDKITPSQIQKAALLGTAHILRRYLS